MLIQAFLTSEKPVPLFEFAQQSGIQSNLKIAQYFLISALQAGETHFLSEIRKSIPVRKGAH
ncbi:hypothetical protein CGI90_25955 [Vibrio parahaemolyticus]|nr:hypothetical protein CGI90_25955 [Vibrio parahaemolyticus]